MIDLIFPEENFLLPIIIIFETSAISDSSTSYVKLILLLSKISTLGIISVDNLPDL